MATPLMPTTSALASIVTLTVELVVRLADALVVAPSAEASAPACDCRLRAVTRARMLAVPPCSAAHAPISVLVLAVTVAVPLVRASTPRPPVSTCGRENSVAAMRASTLSAPTAVIWAPCAAFAAPTPTAAAVVSVSATVVVARAISTTAPLLPDAFAVVVLAELANSENAPFATITVPVPMVAALRFVIVMSASETPTETPP